MEVMGPHILARTETTPPLSGLRPLRCGPQYRRQQKVMETATRASCPPREFQLVPPTPHILSPGKFQHLFGQQMGQQMLIKYAFCVRYVSPNKFKQIAEQTVSINKLGTKDICLTFVDLFVDPTTEIPFGIM